MKKIGVCSLFTLVMGVVLAGCGFHLRGVESFPSTYRAMYIDTSSPNAPVVLSLKQELMDNGVVLVREKSQALTVLELSPLSMDDQAISLLGGGQASTHQLTDSITYTLRDVASDHVIAGPTTLQRSRNYNTNASLALSDNYAVNAISQDLQASLASGIFDELARAASHETAAS